MLDFHDWYHCCHYSGAFHCNHNHYPHIFNYSPLLSLHLLITITVACPILGDLWKSYSGSADLADHPILSYIKVSEWSQCHHLRHHHYHHPPLPFTNKNWKVLFNLILSFQHNLKVRLAWVCKRDESGVFICMRKYLSLNVKVRCEWVSEYVFTFCNKRVDGRGCPL